MEQKMPSFDTLLRMAQENPYQLEQLRNQLANTTINSAPEPLRQRLRGLQFQIDSKCKLAKTPLSACITISNMMHQSLDDLRQILNGTTTKKIPNINKGESFDAVILNFPSKQKSI